jgi:tRNA threonylcarbamoyladenosine biosynthesis protein TsaE
VRQKVLCRDPQATLRVGDALGRAARPGVVIALQGPLGAGKTLLTKGIARGLGVAQWRYVTSPTFAIHNVYQGRLRLHHVDLYRLGAEAELEHLGLEEALYGSDACVIEWPEFLLEDLPADRVRVRILLGSGDERSLEIEATGELGGAVLRELRISLGDDALREESA